MAKLTAAQAYKLQVQADRRAAALERRTEEGMIYTAHVKAVYEGAAQTQFTADGRRRTDKVGRNNEQKRGPKATR